MKYLSLLVLTLLLTATSVQAAPKRDNAIAAVVNDRAITMADLNDRLDLVIKSSNMPNNPELRAKIARQLIGVLIEEQIKIQAAKNEGIEVTQADIDGAFAEMAKQNNIPPEEFKKALESRGIRLRTMYDQISSEIAWGRLVGRKLHSRVDVTDADVANEEARIRESIGHPQYLLSEVFLAVDKPADDAKIKEAATRLAAQIGTNPQIFPQVARQFSASAGAANGGDMGWIRHGQLPEALDKALEGLQKGKVSQPIRSLGGYHLLLLREARTMREEDMPDHETLLDRIGTERLVRLARGYLLNLKAAAFIETRV